MAQAVEDIGYGPIRRKDMHPAGEHGEEILSHDHGPGHDHAHDEHSVLHHHFDDMAQQREATALGMWCFLLTEVMMFGVLMFAYSYYRWRFFPEFLAGSHSLNFQMGFYNTLVLLCSSLTMAMAVHAAQLKDQKKMIRFLGITFVLGAIFIIIKGFEWTADYHEGIVPSLNWDPNPHNLKDLMAEGFRLNGYQMYFVVYFCMTGLHAIHMVIGLGLVAWFMMLGKRGSFTNGNDQPVEILGLYWHFVDIVWVFLFPLLYLIGPGHVAKLFGGGAH